MTFKEDYLKYIEGVFKVYTRWIDPNSNILTLHDFGMPPVVSMEREIAQRLDKVFDGFFLDKVYVPLKKKCAVRPRSFALPLASLGWVQLKKSGLLSLRKCLLT